MSARTSTIGFALLVALIFMVLPGWAWADTVELASGELLQGKVLSLDAKELQFESAALGKLAVPRDKVAAIVLGKPRTIGLKFGLPSGDSSLPPQPAPEKVPNPLGADEPLTVDEILKQLQNEGIDPKNFGSLKKAVPLLSNPDVQKYFNETIGGLLNGKLDVDDIRRQAIRVREEVRDLTKELGPEAEKALSGYLSILDGFIKETEPPKTGNQPADPSQPAPVPSPNQK